jgi:hypothetical protein
LNRSLRSFQCQASTIAMIELFVPVAFLSYYSHSKRDTFFAFCNPDWQSAISTKAKIGLMYFALMLTGRIFLLE